MNPFSEQKNLGLLFARALAQRNVHVHFERERERELKTKNEKEKLRTSERLRERALPRCRDP